MLSLFVAAAMTMTAQSGRSDMFFNIDNEDIYNNRDASISDGGGIGHWGIGEEVPVGTGLLVLAAAGAGYAIVRRKRTHKGAALFLAFAMLFSMTQCKKNVETIHDGTNGVHITLNVDGNSRVIVNPTGGVSYATVTFEDGDIVYVGYNNEYVGTLTYSSDAFSGDVNIDAAVGDQPLHFYFLGGKHFTATISGNTATLNISDQTEHYPVVSYVHSKECYPTTTGVYHAKLVSKCSIMSFDVKTTATNTNATYIEGMKDVVTVNIGTPDDDDNGFSYSYSETSNGKIKLASGAGKKWAIVLPQTDTEWAKAYGAVKEYYKGVRAALPAAIGSNQYLDNSVEVVVNDVRIPVSTTEKAIFAPGNLQAAYVNNVLTWSFAPAQYSFIGNAAGNTQVTNSAPWINGTGTVDLFGWVGASASYNSYGICKMGSSDTFYGNVYNESLKTDWGVPANAAQLDGYNTWHTPERAEWFYALNTRVGATYNLPGTNSSTAKFVLATINDEASGKIYKGMIIFPQKYNHPSNTGYTVTADYIYNTGSNYVANVSLAGWEMMETAGCVFLPAAGGRYTTQVNSLDTNDEKGYYWSSTPSKYTYSNSYYTHFTKTQVNPCIDDQSSTRMRNLGSSVRLIRIVED